MVIDYLLNFHFSSCNVLYVSQKNYLKSVKQKNCDRETQEAELFYSFPEGEVMSGVNAATSSLTTNG